MSTWHAFEGSPYPMGASYVIEEESFNFALYAKTASAVTLLLYREDDLVTPVRKLTLNHLVNKSQRIWHCRIPKTELHGASYYAFSVAGQIGSDPAYWHRYDPDKILLDPYAKQIFFPPGFSRDAAIEPGSNAGKAALCCLFDDSESFDWQGVTSVKHSSDLIIYEVHVKGFTFLDTNVDEGVRGTFAGVTAKIPYLKALGITAVEFMPVHQFDPKENNYWGYMPISFFAPHHSYAADRSIGGALREFRTMVRELHRVGIEVILDVVFNHTAEKGNGGPVYSLKGIDNSSYYLLTSDPADVYYNYSGTGNTLRTDHPVVQQMIMDSLRYWVKEMHIDGFRFDLASVFSRRSDGTIGDSPIFANIAADPALATVRLIAEPWDAGGLYQLGRAFPGLTWFQWNGAYRDDIRRFVKSDEHMVGQLILRLYGSDDLFPDDVFHAYHPYQSVNYIISHDGFTLYDQVSYNHKRNLANGHSNQDGHEPNYSWNCGHEGDEHLPEEVMTLRKRQARNFFTLLMLSNGTPMFLAGDEFLHTQKGNNNPYNQDNPTSWLEWRRLALMQDHFNFVRKLIAFRKQHPSLSRSRFWREHVKFFGPEGDVDYGAGSRSVGVFLEGSAEGDADLYVMINAHWEPKTFHFMEQGQWRRVLDTFKSHPEEPFGENTVGLEDTTSYPVGPRAIAVFIK